MGDLKFSGFSFPNFENEHVFLMHRKIILLKESESAAQVTDIYSVSRVCGRPGR